MAVLSPEQRAFLHSQKILMRDLFDASGLKKQEYQALMKELGQLFAYGVSPCQSAGHTLRSRSGHCIQCDTKIIAFSRRNSDAGTVYIAGSTSSQLLKVGYTNDRQRRATYLCNEKYGGASDWEILAWVNLSRNAGRVEFDIHEALKNKSASGYYMKEGKQVSCYELFRCSYLDAKKALMASIPSDTKVSTVDEARLLEVYNF